MFVLPKESLHPPKKTTLNTPYSPTLSLRRKGMRSFFPLLPLYPCSSFVLFDGTVAFNNAFCEQKARPKNFTVVRHSAVLVAVRNQNALNDSLALRFNGTLEPFLRNGTNEPFPLALRQLKITSC